MGKLETKIKYKTTELLLLPSNNPQTSSHMKQQPFLETFTHFQFNFEISNRASLSISKQTNSFSHERFDTSTL